MQFLIFFRYNQDQVTTRTVNELDSEQIISKSDLSNMKALETYKGN
jgi:hypothetical protein